MTTHLRESYARRVADMLREQLELHKAHVDDPTDLANGWGQYHASVEAYDSFIATAAGRIDSVEVDGGEYAHWIAECERLAAIESWLRRRAEQSCAATG